jgi:hypothetical protein
MRTTLDLDDDVLTHARAVAQAERVALGKVVSRLVRERLAAPEAAGPAAEDGYVYKNGIPVLLPEAAHPRTVTQGLIEQIREEEGI